MRSRRSRASATCSAPKDGEGKNALPADRWRAASAAHEVEAVGATTEQVKAAAGCRDDGDVAAAAGFSRPAADAERGIAERGRTAPLLPVKAGLPSLAAEPGRCHRRCALSKPDADAVGTPFKLGALVGRDSLGG